RSFMEFVGEQTASMPGAGEWYRLQTGRQQAGARCETSITVARALRVECKPRLPLLEGGRPRPPRQTPARGTRARQVCGRSAGGGLGVEALGGGLAHLGEGDDLAGHREFHGVV